MREDAKSAQTKERGYRTVFPQVTQKTASCLVPDYGRKKLTEYAETYRELAENLCTIRSEPGIGYDRKEYLHKVRLRESREIFAGHLRELAEHMEELAGQQASCTRPQSKISRRVAARLKDHGIVMKEIWYLHLPEGAEICLTMKGTKKSDYTTEEIATLLSECHNKKYVPSNRDNLFVGYDFDTYFFEEEPVYRIIKGIAREARSSETVSGDSYAFLTASAGRFYAILSDGVGSGEIAAADSGNVVEMAERYLRAGFNKEEAASFINSMLTADDREQNMPTLDILELNLHSGECSVLKAGASDTFCKSKTGVRTVKNDSMPLGFSGENKWQVEHIDVNDGDYLVMVSDGVSESLDRNIMVEEIVRNTAYRNPGDMADFMLRCAKGREAGQVRDDLTVIVIGVWKSIS